MSSRIALGRHSVVVVLVPFELLLCLLFKFENILKLDIL